MKKWRDYLHKPHTSVWLVRTKEITRSNQMNTMTAPNLTEETEDDLMLIANLVASLEMLITTAGRPKPNSREQRDYCLMVLNAAKTHLTERKK